MKKRAEKKDKNGFQVDNDIDRLLEIIRRSIMDTNDNKENCPVSKAVELYLDAKKSVLSPHTIADYSITFRRFLDFISPDRIIADIDAADIREFLATIPGGKKNKVNAHIALSSLWTFIVLAHCASDHIVRRVEVAKPEIRAIIPLTRDEVVRLLDSARKTGRERTRNKAILLILLDTGIRASELCGLRLSDLADTSLRVMGKGGKERFVPVTPMALAALVAYLETRPPGKRHAPVFLSEDGNQLTRDALRRLVGRLGDRAGVHNVHPHRFRHTFAINYLLNGGDPYTLQMILGHSTMDMVKRYLYLTHKDVSSVHSRASPLIKWNL